MNKINYLFNQEAISKILNKQLLNLYPEIKEFIRVSIEPIKKNIWETTYHVVAKIEVQVLKKDNSIIALPIYFSAHSSEDRYRVFATLNYLWHHGFNKEPYLSPRPIFYDKEFNAVFYQGIEGENLFNLIKNKDYKKAELTTSLAGGWLAKLHNLPVSNEQDFNPSASRIETVIPGRDQVLKIINEKFPELTSRCQSIYNYLIEAEQGFFDLNSERSLIHGDAHPENVISHNEQSVALIDFTDMCLGDRARDLGSFCQQLDYMITYRAHHPGLSERLKNIFLENYYYQSGFQSNNDFNKRIENYYYFAALRTANYYFLKHQPQPEKGLDLLNFIESKLNKSL